ncbi:protein DOWNSTREAM OF FLC-like [Abrus precatorius]|uniref:Protein DOWNSTREAM OF FLC-like n=1 Tax=Abrus precatorius TaxID=3816 RepID=A0A8B8K4U7_ABRPR|nr:protein DOWNSTREAM OF FLC-like [Abrus precatorius]
MASRVVLLLAMCVLPAMVVAIRPAKNPFCVKGQVYCDRCRAGFETSATTYIAGAEVELQCKNRVTNEVVYSKKGWTDRTGSYKIWVNEDHADEVCDAKLVDSHHSQCTEATPGRDQARVILTRYNGIASDDRFVNAMGFMSEEVASGCADILRQYQEFDNEN